MNIIDELTKYKYENVETMENKDLQKSLLSIATKFCDYDKTKNKLYAKVISRKLEYRDSKTNKIDFETYLSFAYCFFLDDENMIVDGFCVSMYPTMYRTCNDADHARKIIDKYGDESDHFRELVMGGNKQCFDA